MNSSKLRRQIIWEAARLIHERRETDCHRAKLKAARRICRGWVKPTDLPTDAEIRDELLTLGRMQDGQPVETLALSSAKEDVDRFQRFAALLMPLENCRQNQKEHPGGDELDHSLQVFDLARDELPYDEEFLLAALLHDVGKAIDPLDHVAAALHVLSGLISQRTLWLIEHHLAGHAVLDKSIGVRAHRRLQESESYDELILLARCDREGHQVGAATCDLAEAIDYIRGLDVAFD